LSSASDPQAKVHRRKKENPINPPKDNQENMVVRLSSVLHSMMVLRFVMAKLALLFFLAHPGSAATFANTQDFLLSRYPNRDVIPSTLLSSSSTSSNGPGDRHNRGGAAWATRSTSRYAFVSVPMAMPVSGLNEAVSAASLHKRGNAASSSSFSSSSAAASPSLPCASGRLSGCHSPPRRRSTGVLNVVVGSFISSLEEAKEAQQRAAAAAAMQFHQHEVVPELLFKPSSSSSSSSTTMAAAAAAAGSYYAAPTGAGGVALQTTGGLSVMAVPTADGTVQMVTTTTTTTDDKDDGFDFIGGVVGGVWRFSSSTIVGAYDNVMNFVESKMVEKKNGGGGSINNGNGSGLTRAFKFPQLNVASMRHDLVGFMDVDPFEKSRRFHKRRSKF